MDETGWFEMAKDFWLWVCTTPDVSVFRIFDSRSGMGAKTLLGENYSGIVGTDRFSGYAWMDPSHRQICWAHLKRDFQALVERGDEFKVVGQMLLSRLKTFFGFWHRYREGTLSRLDLQTVMQPIREEIHNLLEIGTLLGHKKLVELARIFSKSSKPCGLSSIRRGWNPPTMPQKGHCGGE